MQAQESTEARGGAEGVKVTALLSWLEVLSPGMSHLLAEMQNRASSATVKNLCLHSCGCLPRVAFVLV